MTKRKINSRAKGCRAERAWAAKCRDEGFDARRGQQFSGSPDSPDVVCDDLDFLRFEVKHVERLNVYNAMQQAADDAGDRMPVVAHKRNHHDWLVTMTADDWFKLIREYI